MEECQTGSIRVSGQCEDAEVKKGRWSKEEDEQLRRAVATRGDHQWRLISQLVPGRSPIQCLHRWDKILKPGLVKGPWTSSEDAILVNWVRKEGPTKWTQCAEMIPGRSGKQCRERWFNTLDPSVKKGDWQEEEDKTIFRLYKELGAKWKEMMKYLPGRTDNSIKNRFYSTIRKSQNQGKTEITGNPGADAVTEPRVSVNTQVVQLLHKLQNLELLLSHTSHQIVCLEESIEQDQQNCEVFEEIPEDIFF